MKIALHVLMTIIIKVFVLYTYTKKKKDKLVHHLK